MTETSSTRPIKKPSSTGFWKRAFITLAVLFVLCVATIGFLWWWTTRPIKPTILSQPEEQQLELKVARLNGDRPEASTPEPEAPTASEPIYEKGSKTLVFTDRPQRPESPWAYSPGSQHQSRINWYRRYQNQARPTYHSIRRIRKIGTKKPPVLTEAFDKGSRSCLCLRKGIRKLSAYGVKRVQDLQAPEEAG